MKGNFMQHEFLKQFPKRMKNVGLYAMLFGNSSQKTTWRRYGFDSLDEQLNMIFAVMLYLMEQSLKEEPCMMDDIGAYIDSVNTASFEKPMSYEDCRSLGDFIVNIILSNEGRPMYFEGYDFEKREYRKMNISYVANRIVSLDTEVRRTSYRLTDDGYNLLLGTLEIESNMKLTIHEMIFKMHLEKRRYDKAADQIKNVFNLLRMQLQKIQDAMLKIRRNALNYSVRDYQNILEENMHTIRDTRKQFLEYREMVKARAKELEEKHINVHKLNAKEEENLGNLRIIEGYLNRAIDEHQKILQNHLDLKALYTKELEELSQMSLIQRFSLRTELFDKVLQNPAALARMEGFFRPLFVQGPDKIYNLNKAFEPQQAARKKTEQDSQEQIDFDEEQWQREQEMLRRKKLAKYRDCLQYLLEKLLADGEFSLAQCREEINREPDKMQQLIPDVDIFKEIMVELIKSREIDIPALKKERSEFLQEAPGSFQMHEMLLELLEAKEPETGKRVRQISVTRTQDGEPVSFEGVMDESGNPKTIRCSNLLFRAAFAE